MSTCNDRAGECGCVLDTDHDGAHACECGGSWSYDGAGTFIVVRWPDDPDVCDAGWLAVVQAMIPPGWAQAKEAQLIARMRTPDA